MARLGSAAHRLLSLDALLNRPVLTECADEISASLATGRLVVIHDAVRSAFAERIWRALERSDSWRPYENAQDDFHFRHHNLYDPADFPAELLECRLFFDSPDTRAAIAGVSGRDCSATLQFGASWYMPGDHSLPHSDGVETEDGRTRRQVAFIWHLTKDWDSRWGGHLYWGPNQQMLRPTFNSLYLFAVRPEQVHFVAPVSTRATGKRLTVNGWWTGVDAYPEPRVVKGSEPLEL